MKRILVLLLALILCLSLIACSNDKGEDEDEEYSKGLEYILSGDGAYYTVWGYKG